MKVIRWAWVSQIWAGGAHAAVVVTHCGLWSVNRLIVVVSALFVKHEGRCDTFDSPVRGCLFTSLVYYSII